MATRKQEYTYQAGTTLFVRYLWRGRHYGIADGWGGVIHKSKEKRGVVKSTEEEFEGGKEIKVEPAITSDNPGQAVKRAEEYLEKPEPYNLFTSNCEHFVRCCHGVEAESTQIQSVVLSAVGVLGLVAMRASSPPILIASILALSLGLFTPAGKSPLKNIL